MLIITLAAILELVIICSITRKVKNGVFLKNIALCVFVRYMLDSVAGSVPLLALALGIPIGLVILGFSWLTTVLAIAGIVYFVPKWVKKYRLIREGLNEVRNGNFDKKIVLEGNHIGDDLSKSLNKNIQFVIENEDTELNKSPAPSLICFFLSSTSSIGKKNTPAIKNLALFCSFRSLADARR